MWILSPLKLSDIVQPPAKINTLQLNTYWNTDSHIFYSNVEVRDVMKKDWNLQQYSIIK